MGNLDLLGRNNYGTKTDEFGILSSSSFSFFFFFFFFYWSIVDLNIVLVSPLERSESVSLQVFSIIDDYKIMAIILCAIQYILVHLFLYLIHSSLLIPYP